MPQVLSSLLQQAPLLQHLHLHHRLTTLQQNVAPHQESLTDSRLAAAVAGGGLAQLATFEATTSDLHLGRLLLTERSARLLGGACPRLQRVGDMAAWLVEDLEGLLEDARVWGWTRAPGAAQGQMG